RAANEALRALESDPRVSEALLKSARGDASALVRGAAVDTIGSLDPGADVGGGLAAVALEDPDPRVRTHAVDALAELALHGSEPADAELERLASQGADGVQQEARSRLADVDAAKEPAKQVGGEASRGARG